MSKKENKDRRTSAGTNLAPLKKESVGDFIQRSMRIYGTEVNEDRAVPSLQDGLKPVQRRLLWAGHSVAKTKVKAALLVAEAMGKYHPHGDTSIYGAMVTMINSAVPTITGLGNYGSLIDPPAAMRYPNAQLSSFGKTFLERDYLAVTPRVPNYDSTLEEPLYLPALLPSIFMNYTFGVGVGLKTELPNYTPDSLLKMCVRLLDKEELTAKDWAKGLVFHDSWGAELVKSKENFAALKEFYKGATGSLKFYAPVEFDEVRKQIVISKYVPGVKIESSDKKRNEKGAEKEGGKDKGLGVIDKIRKFSAVDNVDSGEGLSYIIQLKKSVNTNECKALHAKVQAMFTAKQSFNVFVTERKADVEGKYNVVFHNTSVPDVLMRWLKFRVKLEVASLKWRITEQEKAIAKTLLLILACSKLEVIFAALKKRLSKEELCKAIMKGLKITEAEAKQVMDLRVHQLSKLDQELLEDQLKEERKVLKALQRDVKDPVSVVRNYLQSMVGKFKLSNSTNPQQWQWVL